jgi:hypothetical protein
MDAVSGGVGRPDERGSDRSEASAVGEQAAAEQAAAGEHGTPGDAENEAEAGGGRRGSHAGGRAGVGGARGSMTDVTTGAPDAEAASGGAPPRPPRSPKEKAPTGGDDNRPVRSVGQPVRDRPVRRTANNTPNRATSGQKRAGSGQRLAGSGQKGSTNRSERPRSGQNRGGSSGPRSVGERPRPGRQAAGDDEQASGQVAGDADTGEETPREGVGAASSPSHASSEQGSRQARAPWHFKVLLVGTVVYLGWRLYQGIGWLVHHV